MIHTSKQLKDKIRNISKSDSRIAQALIRNFVMERFLERVSVSKYRDVFVLKGGMLVASLVGVNLRSTMDIDTTVNELSISETNVRSIINEIIDIPIGDSVTFKIDSCKEIMSDFEYPGIRVIMSALLEKMKQQFKIDISTGDIVTPSAIEYEFKLMFENRTIQLMTYNVETLLAEKLQTILSRDIANTRMRDFYDIYTIIKEQKNALSKVTLVTAFETTCRKRGTIFTKHETNVVLSNLTNNPEMMKRWNAFREDNYFVGDITWTDTTEAVRTILHAVY